MNKTIQFKHNARATVHEFDSLEMVAAQTAPYLQKQTVGLSGGSTYKQLFPLWIHNKPDCSQTAFFPVDERLVGFDDPNSNWGVAYRLFFTPLGKHPEKSHFASSLNIYREILQTFFGSSVPVFDVIFLGVGSDGHTASLFPNQPYLSDQSSAVLATKSPQPPTKRITLGPKVLVSSRTLITIVSGQDKKKVVKGIYQKNKTLPIVRILSQHPNSILYIDKHLIPSPV